MSKETIKPLILALLLCGMVGCKPEMAHWENHPTFLYHTDNWQLVCNDGGKVIAIVNRYNREPFYVFGGNGAGYGEYTTLESAKAKAITLNRFPISSLLRCP